MMIPKLKMGRIGKKSQMYSYIPCLKQNYNEDNDKNNL